MLPPSQNQIKMKNWAITTPATPAARMRLAGKIE